MSNSSSCRECHSFAVTARVVDLGINTSGARLPEQMLTMLKSSPRPDVHGPAVASQHHFGRSVAQLPKHCHQSHREPKHLLYVHVEVALSPRG
jgi:hypothetical protein